MNLQMLGLKPSEDSRAPSVRDGRACANCYGSLTCLSFGEPDVREEVIPHYHSKAAAAEIAGVEPASVFASPLRVVPEVPEVAAEEPF